MTGPLFGRLARNVRLVLMVHPGMTVLSWRRGL